MDGIITYQTNHNLERTHTLLMENKIIKGDSLFYDRNKSYGKAINNISMIDTLNKIIVNGNFRIF